MPASESKIDLIDGWFPAADQAVFRGILAGQEHPGTLVELGVFLGKSAVLIGDYRREGEEFVVVDLFGRTDLVGGEESTIAEADIYTSRLTQQQFEANYLGVHPELPTVVCGPTSVACDHVESGTARFIHIDASHQYEHVVVDIENSRRMARPDGVIVFDDFRSVHTPGVSAAMWGAIDRGEVVPVAHTDQKMYCAAQDPGELHRLVQELVARGLFEVNVVDIAGKPVSRLIPCEDPAKKAAKEAARLAADEKRAAAEKAAREEYAQEWARTRLGFEPGMSPVRLAGRILARTYLPAPAKRVLKRVPRRPAR